MTKQVRKKSLFVQYVISYFSVALLSCAIIGLTMFYSSVDMLRREELAQTEVLIELAIQDMETQFDLLEEIALDIAVHEKFNPIFLRQNKHNEIQMLDELSQYRDNSILCQNFFLIYGDSDILYLASGKTNTREGYGQLALNIPEPELEDVYERILGSKRETIISYGHDDCVLAVFPINIPGKGAMNYRIKLCFVLSRQALAERMHTVSTFNRGQMMLMAKGSEILLTPTTEPPLDEAELLGAESNRFRFAVKRRSGDIQTTLPWFSHLNGIITIIGLCIVVGLVFLGAYLGYHPIQKLYYKYIRGVSPKPSNELKLIDLMLQESMEKYEFAANEMTKYIQIVRSQLLTLMLNGEYAEALDDKLAAANISFPEPCFCVLAVHFLLKEQGVLPERLLDLTEADETPNIYRYALVQDEEKNVIVLINMGEEVRPQECVSALSAVYEKAGYQTVVGMGTVCRERGRIPISYQDAIANCHCLENERILLHSFQEKQIDHTRHIRVIQDAIRAGDEREALKELDNLIQELSSVQPSVFSCRYAAADLAVRLASLANTLQIDIGENLIRTMLYAHTIPAIRESGQVLIRCICEEVNQRISNGEEEEQQAIMQYFADHFADQDFSLESLADQFYMSVSGITRRVKQAAGMSFKNYLIHLRMEEAKKLLSSKGMSVKDTARRVGYNNVSHFIKTFKRIVGVSPSSYIDWPM